MAKYPIQKQHLRFDQKFIHSVPIEAFGEAPELSPCNTFCFRNSHVKIRGTEYMKYLEPLHILQSCEEDDSEVFEIEFAEYPTDMNFTLYEMEDADAYERILDCYLAMYNDGDMKVCSALASAVGQYGFIKKFPTYAYHFYYLFKGLEIGDLCCMSHIAYLYYDFGDLKNAFYWSQIGANRDELFCMWNYAWFHLYGLIVPKDYNKAIEIYKRMLKLINNPYFIVKEYGKYNNKDVCQLGQKVERNLRLLMSSDLSFEKYFDLNLNNLYWDIRRDVISKNKGLNFKKGEELINLRFQECCMPF